MVNLIAMVLKFGDRTQIGAVQLATSLVASLQLIAAAAVWAYATNVATMDGLTREMTASVISLRRSAVRQRRLGRPPGGRDRVLPASLSRESPWGTHCSSCGTGSSPSRTRAGARTAGAPAARATWPAALGGILLVLRRMRIPLIVLIVIFAVSVLGLTLVPGEDAQGRPTRLGIFEAFYFMSFTATTIGLGEIPYTFTPAQRMWVTFAIFLSVIGWAYAVGSSSR